MDSAHATSQPAGVPSRTGWRIDLLALTAVFGLLFFFVLGSHPLSNPDEGRYAEIPREMIASGDWVLPHLDGVVYFEKPPLVYWCTAVAFKLFGYGEWPARSVPALFALGGVLLTYAATRPIYGRSAGLAAAAILGTSLLYYGLSRLLLLDMVVSVLLSATLYCFILAVREPPGGKRRALFYGMYVGAALATLAKGLIGFLLPGAVMFLWLLVFNQWRRLRPQYLVTGLALFFAVALPWHILAAERNSQWAWFYLYQEHWLRFTTKMHGRYGPWWYFIPVVLAGFFPWIGYAFSAARDCLHGAWARRRKEVDTWFFVFWAAFIFLFFSDSDSKLIPYILPVFPAMATLVGAWIVRVLEQGRAAALKAGMVTYFAGSAIFAVAAIVVVVHPQVMRESEPVIAARPYLILCAVALVLGMVASRLVWVRRGPKAGLIAQAVASGVFFSCVALTYPEFPMRETRELAAIVNARGKPQDLIYHYHCFAHDFLFYTGRLVGTVDHLDELEVAHDPKAQASGRFIDSATFRKKWQGPLRVWAVARNGDDLQRLFADPTFHYYQIASNARYTLFSNRP